MPSTVLSLQNVTKRFAGFTAVNNLSFEVRTGEIFGFLGPNGAGKTTTLRMALDITAPTGGSVSVLGSPSAIPVRHRIGYLPEERGLYRKMRAGETIAYFARLRGVPAREARVRADTLLRRFGLGEFARARNETLSKGMAQKVQLLATIAHEPELLILDEPFSGLDPINQKALEDLIRTLKAEGRTIIFSTHVMEHAERLCDRFLILGKGEKRFEGDLETARAAMPPRVMIRTGDAIDALLRLPGVLSVRAQANGAANGGENDAPISGEIAYEVALTAGVDPQSILKGALAAGIRLTKFEQGGASLHDIFVAVAGPGVDAPDRELAA